MAQQYRVVRKVNTVQITPGGFATIDLPRGYDLETVFMRINAVLNVTAAATAVRAEAPVQLVPRVELVADGKNNLFSAPFWALSLGKFDRLMTQQSAGVTTAPSGTAIASYTVEAVGALDQMFVDGVRPKDTNFRTSGLQIFQLRLTFGQAADCFVGGTVALTSGTVEVYTQELVELPDAQGNYTNPVGLKKVSYQEIALLASNANQEIRLPAGNLIKSVFFRCEGAVTQGEPSSATLNNVQLASGVDVRYNITGAQMKRKNSADIGKVQDGYFFADFPATGYAGKNLTELWDVTNQAEPKAILDVVGSATTKMQVVTTEIILAQPK